MVHTYLAPQSQYGLGRATQCISNPNLRTILKGHLFLFVIHMDSAY